MQWQCAAAVRSFARCKELQTLYLHHNSFTTLPGSMAQGPELINTVQGVQDCQFFCRSITQPSRRSWEGAWRTCRSWPLSGLGSSNKSHESHENIQLYSLLGMFGDCQIHNSTSAAGHQGLGMAGIVATRCWCFQNALRCHWFYGTLSLPAHHHQAPRPLPGQEGWSSHLH